MATARLPDDWPASVAEFEVWHADQPDRWEFIDGRPWMMAPASMRHSVIKNNIGFMLRRSLDRSDCTALVDGPQILTDTISAIPDVVVTCTELDLSTPVIALPVIIVEVMSPSSERDDTEREWWSYRKIPSLRHYIVLAQDEQAVLVHSRAGDLWHERFLEHGAIELDDPPARLELDLIYQGVTFES
jgi:Uma2 family endonuclease